jgi:hypothetical protein
VRAAVGHSRRAGDCPPYLAVQDEGGLKHPLNLSSLGKGGWWRAHTAPGASASGPAGVAIPTETRRIGPAFAWKLPSSHCFAETSRRGRNRRSAVAINVRGSVRGVLPKGPERGPLSPRDPFCQGLGGLQGRSQHADMAVRAPVRLGQHALRRRPLWRFLAFRDCGRSFP